MNYSIKVAEKGLINYLPDIGIQKVKDEIIAGLQSEQKYISCIEKII